MSKIFIVEDCTKCPNFIPCTSPKDFRVGCTKLGKLGSPLNLISGGIPIDCPLNDYEEPKTGHWIPVSERLPEDKTYVLTAIKVPNRIAHARSGWYEGGFFHNDNGDTWKATDMEVIAWMPLPEPYKAESEEI